MTRLRALHWLFEMSLVIKGALCSAELVAGIGLLLVPNQFIARLVFFLTHYEIAEDPSDTLANWTRSAIEAFPLGTQHFYGWYLLAHGGLKLAMVVMLWANPVGLSGGDGGAVGLRDLSVDRIRPHRLAVSAGAVGF